jgi:hypothetical protein
MNASLEPCILRRIGVQIIEVAQVKVPYGVPQTAKIQRGDDFELEMPDIFAILDRHALGDIKTAGPHKQEIENESSRFLNLKATKVMEKVLLQLPDPMYMESKAPYRYSLKLKHYQERIPNHAIFRLAAETIKGESLSHALRTFTG